MKKLILFLFVALLTQVFTSCKDDDVYHITDTDLNGVYLGTMDVERHLEVFNWELMILNKKFILPKQGKIW